MNPNQSRLRTALSRGFTLVEMLVVITIIVVLASLGFLGYRTVMDASRKATSLSNLRQIGVGVALFTAENNNYLPLSRFGGSFWPTRLYPYVPQADIFLRPGSKNAPMSPEQPDGYFGDVSTKIPDQNVPLRWNYTVNGGAVGLPFSEDSKDPNFARGYSVPFSKLDDPARTVFFADGTAWWLNAQAVPDSNRIYRWRNGSTNVLFGDGSAPNLNPKTDLTANDFRVTKR